MKLQIETYHGCNARCSICTINRWTRPKGQMSEVLFRTVVEQARDLVPELEVISLYMDGEPLLDKDIVQRISTCKSSGLPHVGFSSNGSLLTAKAAAELLDVGMDWIAISLDSMDTASYDKIRIRLDHATVVENVHTLIREREKRNQHMEIALRYLDFKENRQTFSEYKAYWRQYLRDTDKIVCSPHHNWGESEEAPEQSSNAICEHIFKNMVVLSDGTVPMCCVDYNAETPMGHISALTLKEIWSGEEFKNIRSLHSDGKRSVIPRCRKCNVY